MLVAELRKEFSRFWRMKLTRRREFDAEDFLQFGDHGNAPERRREVDHVLGTLRAVGVVGHLQGTASDGAHDARHHLLCGKGGEGGGLLISLSCDVLGTFRAVGVVGHL